MAERSGAIENQARDGASERSESSVGEEIGAPESTWKTAVRASWSDFEWFHNEKGVSWGAFLEYFRF